MPIDYKAQVYGVGEAAKVLGITRDGVHKAIQRGRLPARKSEDIWLINAADVELYRETDLRRK